MIAALRVDVLCKFSRFWFLPFLQPCTSTLQPFMCIRKNEIPQARRRSGKKISLNNQFFETQHKNKLDECVEAVEEAEVGYGWMDGDGGREEKRS